MLHPAELSREHRVGLECEVGHKVDEAARAREPVVSGVREPDPDRAPDSDEAARRFR